MVNFALGGMGSTIQNFQENQLKQAMQRMQMQQQQQQFQQQQQQQQQQMQQAPGALKAFAALQPGANGVTSPQQIAGIAPNMDMFNSLMNASKGYNTGQFGLDKTQMSGQNAYDRTALAGENSLARQNAANAGKMDQEKARLAGQEDIVKLKNDSRAALEKQQEDAGKYNRATSAGGKVAAGKNLEYDTAKATYLEAEKDMRNLQNTYRDSPDPMAYFNSPQWSEIAKRRNEALDNMKQAAASGGKAVPAQAQSSNPPMPGAKKAPDGNWYVETSPGQFSKVEQ